MTTTQLPSKEVNELTGRMEAITANLRTVVQTLGPGEKLEDEVLVVELRRFSTTLADIQTFNKDLSDLLDQVNSFNLFEASVKDLEELNEITYILKGMNASKNDLVRLLEDIRLNIVLPHFDV